MQECVHASRVFLRSFFPILFYFIYLFNFFFFFLSYFLFRSNCRCVSSTQILTRSFLFLIFQSFNVQIKGEKIKIHQLETGNIIEYLFVKKKKKSENRNAWLIHREVNVLIIFSSFIRMLKERNERGDISLKSLQRTRK